MEDHKQYTDKYFLRTRQILEAEDINPFVRMQVFSRTAIDNLTGINEALELIDAFSSLEINGGRVLALPEGSTYSPKETMMLIEGRIQDFVELETVYLGVISDAMTKAVKGGIDLRAVEEKAKLIVEAAEDKPVLYFGARHFHWKLDQQIAQICHDAGFVGTSTDVGAEAWGAEGIGTVPHALVLSYAAAREGNPTVNAMVGFDRHIDPSVPRLLLPDTYNREVDDTIATAEALDGRLTGTRIDTCGENVTQYAERHLDEVRELVPESEYLSGNGVKIASVWALKRELMNAGYGDLTSTVSSGFNERKTAAFLEANRIFQERYGVNLVDAIGTGSIASPVMATADIAQYRDDEGNWIDNSKVGRGYRANSRLEVVLGGK